VAAMELIYQHEYETDTQTDLTISNIPQTYTHLKLHCQFRRYPNSDAYFTTYVMPNGDTGNCWYNYVSNGGYRSVSSTDGGSVGPGSSPTISYKGAIIDLLWLGYTNTTSYKTCFANGGYQHFNGWSTESNRYMGIGTWASTSALTSLRIYPPGGSNKWNGGSSLYLWGWNDNASA